MQKNFSALYTWIITVRVLVFEETTVPQGSSGQLTNNHLWQYILDIVLKYNIILMKKVNSETSDWQRKSLWVSGLVV